jgi:hypothetical protein
MKRRKLTLTSAANSCLMGEQQGAAAVFHNPYNEHQGRLASHPNGQRPDGVLRNYSHWANEPENLVGVCRLPRIRDVPWGFSFYAVLA